VREYNNSVAPAFYITVFEICQQEKQDFLFSSEQSLFFFDYLLFALESSLSILLSVLSATRTSSLYATPVGAASGRQQHARIPVPTRP